MALGQPNLSRLSLVSSCRNGAAAATYSLVCGGDEGGGVDARRGLYLVPGMK